MLDIIKAILKLLAYVAATLAIVFIICATMIIGESLGMPL